MGFEVSGEVNLFILIFSGVFGSGLCVLSKYPIVTTLFHAWSVNGYVHRIQHGDWFGGKGVGLCQILANGHPVNIYIAHVRLCCHLRRDNFHFSLTDNNDNVLHLGCVSFMLNTIARVTTTMHIVWCRLSIQHNSFYRRVAIPFCKCWPVI